MFDNARNAALTVFGALIALAIIAVVVSRQSGASQAITDISGELVKVVKAAVNLSPISQRYGSGDTGTNNFTLPSL